MRRLRLWWQRRRSPNVVFVGDSKTYPGWFPDRPPPTGVVAREPDGAEVSSAGRKDAIDDSIAQRAGHARDDGDD
jgi:hypothetical protein